MTVTARTAASETGRKLIHIAFGLAAFLLRYLTWGQALLLAFAAFLHNRFVLPVWLGRHIARESSGRDAGILIYPVVVFLLIFVFRDAAWIAAAVWTILAFGDGVATIAGRGIRSPRLPWNVAKSTSGLLAHVTAGSIMALAAAAWTGPSTMLLPWWSAIIAGALVAGIVETLPLGLDDNLTQCVAAAGVIAWGAAANGLSIDEPGRVEWIWLLINIALAVVGFAVRSVTFRGAATGIILGALLIFCGGWPLYVALLAFFVLGTAATKAGWREKVARGIEQEQEGRRGARHAFANVGVAALCVLIAATTLADEALMRLAAFAALATAAADTASSEIGQWLGRRTYLPASFRPVPPGTEGAVSLEGTVAGAVAAGIVSLTLLLSDESFASWKGVAIVTVSAVAAAYLESLLGSWNRTRAERIPNTLMNFLNTAAGALIAMGIYAALESQV